MARLLPLLAMGFAAGTAACGGAASQQPSHPAPPSVSPAASSQPAQKTEKMVVAYTAVNTDQMTPMVAKEQGFFAQNGLDVEVVPVGGGSSPPSGVISGQYQVVQTSLDAIEADLNGADLVYVASPNTALIFWLYTIPSIRTADELKGKRVAVTGLGTSTHIVAKAAVRSLKLDAEKDVTYSAVNNPPAILAAMQSGAVQAGSVGVQTRRAFQKSGFYELVDVSKIDVSYPSGWPVMSRKYIEGHQDAVQRYMKSVVQAIAWEFQHPAETQQLMAKTMKTEDMELVKDNFDLGIAHLRKAPYPDLQGVRSALEEVSATMPQAKTADPSNFVEPRFVKSLDESGFIANLYK